MMETNTCIRSNMFGHVEHEEKAELTVMPGIWIGGKTYWLNSEFDQPILEEGILIQLEQERVQSNIRMDNVAITNQHQHSLHVKLLFQYRYPTVNNHFSFISPSENVIFHFADNSIFLINGHCQGNVSGSYSVQSGWNIYNDKFWACSETGKLKYNPMANGNAVSLQIFSLNIEGNSTREGKSWIIGGKQEQELVKLNNALLKNTLAFRIEK